MLFNADIRRQNLTLDWEVKNKHDKFYPKKVKACNQSLR